MDRDRIESWCQKGMLAVVIAAMWFAAIAFGGVDLWARMVLLWLMVLGLGLFAVRLIVARRPRLLLPPAFWAATLFMAYACGRYWYAEVEYVARQEVIRILICYVVFVLVATALVGQRAMKTLAYSLMFLATLEAAYGIYQWAVKPGTVLGILQNEVYLARGSGSFFNPNHLAGLVGLVLPLTILFAAVSREPHWVRIIASYCAGVQVMGILASGSRGGVVAVVFSVMVLGAFLVLKIKSRVAMAVGVAVVVGLGLVIWQMPKQLKERFSQTRKQLTPDGRDARELIWAAGIGVWREEPWFGAGPDHFDQNFRPHRDLWLQSRPRRVHNEYLQIMADFGIAGISLVILFFLALAWSVARAWPHLGREQSGIESRSNSTRLACAAGCMIGLLFGAIHCLVEFNLFLPVFGISTAVFLGSCGSAGWNAFGRTRVGPPSQVIRWLLATVAMIGSCVLVAVAVRGSRESILLRSVERLPFGSAQQEMALRHAIRHEPKNPDTHFALGENLRVRAFEGEAESDRLAREAIDSFGIATRLSPRDPFIWGRQAMCYDLIGETSMAESSMAEALRLDPQNKHIVTLMGWHKLQIGEVDDAFVYLERALNRMPGAPDPLAGILLDMIARESKRKAGKIN